MSRKHYCTLLLGEGDTNTIYGNDVPKPIDNDDVDIPSHSHEKLKVAIMHLKINNAAASLMVSPLNCSRPDVISG